MVLDRLIGHQLREQQNTSKDISHLVNFRELCLFSAVTQSICGGQRLSDEVEHRIPLIEERSRVHKRVVERDVVNISTVLRERERVITEAFRCRKR